MCGYPPHAGSDPSPAGGSMLALSQSNQIPEAQVSGIHVTFNADVSGKTLQNKRYDRCHSYCAPEHLWQPVAPAGTPVLPPDLSCSVEYHDATAGKEQTMAR